MFDMVAEQSPDLGGGRLICYVLLLSRQVSHDDDCHDDTTITSSSRDKERNHWSSKLQEEPDIKSFANDPKLNPHLPSPTSCDGVKPSYVEWSEELLSHLSVTDYREFASILQAVTGRKDVITKNVFIEGVLSEIIDQIKAKNLELEAITSGATTPHDPDAEASGIKGEIKTLNEKKASRESTLMKADNFLRYVLLHSTSGNPSIVVRRIMRTSSSDSDVVTGLEIWRQMAVTYAQTRVVTLRKQIMTPTEWNPEKSPNVLQMYHHWLELISRYESLNSEKIASSIKITLALQNVRGPLANALSLSINEKSTWNEIHTLLINYFNNSIPSDSKEIYQFDVSSNVSKEGFSELSRQKGERVNQRSQKDSRRARVLLRITIRTKERGSQRNNQKERLNQKEKVNVPHGQVNLGHGIRVKVKVGKERIKDIKYVLIVVAKVTQ